MSEQDARVAEIAGGFVLKLWSVTVSGYGTAAYEAVSRGKALADAWRCGAFGNLSLGGFLRIAQCRRDHDLPPRFGDPITVGKQPAFFVSNNRQYVRFVRPGSDVIMSSHPYDVEPEQYRPDTYLTRPEGIQTEKE